MVDVKVDEILPDLVLKGDSEAFDVNHSLSRVTIEADLPDEVANFTDDSMLSNNIIVTAIENLNSGIETNFQNSFEMRSITS